MHTCTHTLMAFYLFSYGSLLRLIALPTTMLQRALISSKDTLKRFSWLASKWNPFTWTKLLLTLSPPRWKYSSNTCTYQEGFRISQNFRSKNNFVGDQKTHIFSTTKIFSATARAPPPFPAPWKTHSCSHHNVLVVCNSLVSQATPLMSYGGVWWSLYTSLVFSSRIWRSILWLYYLWRGCGFGVFARRIIIITSSTVTVDELDNKRRCMFLLRWYKHIPSTAAAIIHDIIIAS